MVVLTLIKSQTYFYSYFNFVELKHLYSGPPFVLIYEYNREIKKNNIVLTLIPIFLSLTMSIFVYDYNCG